MLKLRALFRTADVSLFVFPQCPLNRVATVEEEDCNCVVGPPGQRGLPGRMVTHTHTHTNIALSDKNQKTCDIWLVSCPWFWHHGSKHQSTIDVQHPIAQLWWWSFFSLVWIFRWNNTSAPLRFNTISLEWRLLHTVVVIYALIHSGICTIGRKEAPQPANCKLEN